MKTQEPKRSKKTACDEPWRDPSIGPCACSQLRRTSRAISTLYDDFLSASGLTVTQYALLVNIARTDGISRTKLAAKLGMERTTLTRNLRPLEQENLIDEEPGSDRRERVLQLTPGGRRRLDLSFPLWEQAQRAFFAEFGQKQFEQLRSLLTTASKAAKAAVSNTVHRKA